ncbi:MAG TPA: DUF2306 domain-containing protein [Opitutaceae bacterium]|nr:DUF2306 domain-containing protein [Opitutaceae bacterium]
MSTTTSASATRSPAKLIFFVLFLAATAFVTFMKNRDAFVSGSPLALHYAPAKWFLAVHAVFGALALILGVFQFSNRLRARYLAQHRFLGYVYVLGVLVAAPLAVPVVMKIGTPSLIAATIMQSFGWLLTTLIGLYCIKQGNVQQHRRWMIRSYPFAMVFTVTRLIIPLPPVMASGVTGIEIVVWSAVALAAFLPTVFLDWRLISPKRKAI